ncbi:5572_t:CDS:2 [Entrophospora sp. SA101]|nr:5572_t:CDS:2 [Entrophospora sp. SA101]
MLTQCEKIMIKNSTINLKPLTRTLRSIFTSSTILLSSLPAFAHFISNNLSLIILSIMSPPTFTVLANLKILTAAGTSVYTEFIMKDKFGACSIELVASSIIKVSGNITKVYASTVQMYTNGVSNGSKGGNGNSGKGDENSNNHNHNRNSSCIVVNNNISLNNGNDGVFAEFSTKGNYNFTIDSDLEQSTNTSPF